MFPSHFIAPSAHINAMDDEARPRINNKRGSSARQRDTKPRLLLPPRVAKRITSTKRSGIYKSILPGATITTITTDMNVASWMQEICPQDIIPKIFAFAGPQMAAVFHRTNTFWRDSFQDDATWRILCEELYKWKEGDNIPHSWKEFYRLSPCVPTDYPSIPAALAIASDHDEQVNHHTCNINPRVMEQRRSIKIWLRPGDYFMREGVVIQAVAENTCVTIQSMEVPKTPFIEVAPEQLQASVASTLTTPAKGFRGVLNKASSIRQALSCRSVSVVQDEALELDVLPRTVHRATLISRTRRLNEPLIRVRQGTLKLVNLNLIHNSSGIDIWNGNAAIQIQPPIGPDDVPVLATPRPRALLEHVNVCSKSGRGIVAIDGGSAGIANSYIHDCAATGIYVGGVGSNAIIHRTDVVRNGNGNGSTRRGVQGGHSGIYLEQGQAIIRDCNISENSLTGISAVSQDNAVLHISESDIVANGVQQLEMPPDGTTSRRRSFTRDNNIASTGYSRSRSGLGGGE